MTLDTQLFLTYSWIVTYDPPVDIPTCINKFFILKIKESSSPNGQETKCLRRILKVIITSASGNFLERCKIIFF